MLSNLGRAVEQTKPRILVCTPSNAACDELLTRVMSEGFCDGSGACMHACLLGCVYMAHLPAAEKGQQL
jgi:hypothetical protein